jgi:exopolyphosphatase/guanosine-5'-triphosphate,3'-diphosphate pyrophosphatase
VISVPRLRTLAAHSRLIGLAGTVSTLVTLELGSVDYDSERVHLAVLPAPRVARWCDVLSAEPAAARGARPGIEPGREDVIVGGVLVLREVMTRFGFAECLVSEADILDGLVASLDDESR